MVGVLKVIGISISGVRSGSFALGGVERRGLGFKLQGLRFRAVQGFAFET